jgi:hypothetical protein
MRSLQEPSTCTMGYGSVKRPLRQTNAQRQDDNDELGTVSPETIVDYLIGSSSGSAGQHGGGLIRQQNGTTYPTGNQNGSALFRVALA